MRGQDIQIFCDAAKHIGVYILVRTTNEASLQHIGKPHCSPKPISCKAKTADAPGVRAGLVVSPAADPTAFTTTRLPDAVKWWNAFRSILNASPRY